MEIIYLMWVNKIIKKNINNSLFDDNNDDILDLYVKQRDNFK